MRKRWAAFSLSCSQNYFHLHALLHSINVPGRAFVESDYASAMPLKLRPNSLSCARASPNFVHETQASSKLRFVAHMTPPWLYGVFRRDSIQNRQCLLASVQIASCISYLGLLRTEYRRVNAKYLLGCCCYLTQRATMHCATSLIFALYRMATY